MLSFLFWVLAYVFVGIIIAPINVRVLPFIDSTFPDDRDLDTDEVFIVVALWWVWPIAGLAVLASKVFRSPLQAITAFINYFGRPQKRQNKP